MAKEQSRVVGYIEKGDLADTLLLPPFDADLGAREHDETRTGTGRKMVGKFFHLIGGEQPPQPLIPVADQSVGDTDPGVVNGNVTFAASDFGLANSYQVSRQPTNGSVSVTSQGEWTYTPNATVTNLGSGVELSVDFDIRALNLNGNAGADGTIDINFIGVGATVPNTTITLQEAVPQGLPFLITEAIFAPAPHNGAIFASAADGGGDLRLYTDSSKTTRLPIYVQRFDTSAEECRIWTRHAGAAFAATDELYLEYGEGGSQPAADAAFGAQDAIDFFGFAADGMDKNLVDDATTDFVGAPTLNATGGPNGGPSRTFDGTNDVIETNYAQAANVKTLVAWVKASSFSNDGALFGNAKGILNSWSNGPRIRFIAEAVGGQGAWGVTAPTVDTWHRIAVVFDGSAQANKPLIYIDGVLQALNADINPTSNALGDWGNEFAIGAYGVGGSNNTLYRLDAEIAEPRIYIGAMTAAQIAADYSNQNDPAAFATASAESAGSGPPQVDNRTWKLQIDPTPYDIGADRYTNAIRGKPAPWRIFRSGNPTMELQDAVDAGHVNLDGTLKDLPADATQAQSPFVLLSTLSSQPHWVGRTIVFRVESGTLGTGNTLRLFGINQAWKTVDTPSRVEYQIPSNSPGDDWVLPTVDVTAPGLVSNLKLTVYDKAYEAWHDDIANNPYKEIHPLMVDWLEPFDVMRLMDQCGTIFDGSVQWKDRGQSGDQSYFNNGQTYSNSIETITGLNLRNGGPILPWLDLCENGYASGPKEAWVNLPTDMAARVRRFSLLESLASGVSQSRFWFADTLIDTSTVVESVGVSKGTLTVSADGKSFTYNCGSGNFPGLTADFQEERVDWRFNSQPVGGGPVTEYIVPLRVIRFGAGDVYRVSLYNNLMMSENGAQVIGSSVWDESADDFLDEVVASGYSTTRALYVEVGNELWNGAAAFEPGGRYAKGFGEYYSRPDSTEGHGIIAAKWRKHIEERAAARSLTYNFVWVAATHMAGSGVTQKMFDGYEYFWETVEGLSGAALDAKLSTYRVYGTTYWEGALNSLDAEFTSNITGLSGAAHNSDILSRLAANAAQLEDDYVAFYDDTVTSKPYNVKRILDDIVLHKTIAQSFGSDFDGFYEGGNHEIRIPSGLTSDTSFQNWYHDKSSNSMGARVHEAFYDEILAVYPTIMLAVYAGPQTTGNFGGPWNKGSIYEDPNEVTLKIKSYGKPL